MNKALGLKWQALYSYKLGFRFTTPAGILEYLNGRDFTVPKVWFLEDFYKKER